MVIWGAPLRRDGGLIYLCSAGGKPRPAFCLLFRADGFHSPPYLGGLLHPSALWSDKLSVR